MSPQNDPSFSAFVIGVHPGMRPLVLGCASSLIPMCQVIYRVSCAGLSPVGMTQRFYQMSLPLTGLEPAHLRLLPLSYKGI